MRLPRSLRTAGARLLRGIPSRIVSGPNQGLKWSLASSGRGYRSGRFEVSRLEALEALVNPGDHVWDIGAHKGYVSMALARRVGSAGSIVAFEPSGANLWFLRRHVDWNGLSNVRILPVAVSDREGQELFGGRGSSITFRLGQGSERVRVTTLHVMQAEEALHSPDMIKIDVEGTEGAVLRGAADLLTEELLLFISIHNRSCYDECRAVLWERGFRLYPSVALANRLAHPARDWGADHELLAVGPNSHLRADVIRNLALFATQPD